MTLHVTFGGAAVISSLPCTTTCTNGSTVLWAASAQWAPTVGEGAFRRVDIDRAAA